jgi:hypothetical protein
MGLLLVGITLAAIPEGGRCVAKPLQRGRRTWRGERCRCDGQNLVWALVALIDGRVPDNNPRPIPHLETIKKVTALRKQDAGFCDGLIVREARKFLDGFDMAGFEKITPHAGAFNALFGASVQLFAVSRRIDPYSPGASTGRDSPNRRGVLDAAGVPQLI